MGASLSQSVARTAAIGLAVAVVACGGGGDGSHRANRANPSPAASSPTSTSPVHEIDLSKPIPGGSLHGTPRPPLRNTGTDYVAILKSLIANFRWLTENPDPAVIDDLYAPGTEDHTAWVAAFRDLVSRGWRAADDGYQVLSVDVVEARASLVNLRLTDAMDFERLIDANGQQVGQGRTRVPRVKTSAILLSIADGTHWRIAHFSSTDGGVQL